MIHTAKGFKCSQESRSRCFSGTLLLFLMIQQMLAIWSLVPLPFLNPACTSGHCWFTYCWSLAWKILTITLLTWNKHSCIVYSFNRQVQLRQAGFSKAWCGGRMRNKMQEFIERQRSGDQHHSKVKVLKLNPSQLDYTFSHEWNNMQWVKLELMWPSRPKHKMIINRWVIRKQ